MTAQTQQFPMREAIIPIGERNGLELAVMPRGKKSAGDVILAADSTALIHGVRIEPLRIHPDGQPYGISMRPWQEALQLYLREKSRGPLAQERRARALSAGAHARNVGRRKS